MKRRHPGLLLVPLAFSTFFIFFSNTLYASFWADQDGEYFVIIDDGVIAFWGKFESRSARFVFERHEGKVRFCIGFNRESGEASDCLAPVTAASIRDDSAAYQTMIIDFGEYPYLLRLIESDLANGSLLYVTLTVAEHTVGYRFHQLHELSPESWDLLTEEIGGFHTE